MLFVIFSINSSRRRFRSRRRKPNAKTHKLILALGSLYFIVGKLARNTVHDLKMVVYDKKGKTGNFAL